MLMDEARIYVDLNERVDKDIFLLSQLVHESELQKNG